MASANIDSRSKITTWSVMPYSTSAPTDEEYVHIWIQPPILAERLDLTGGKPRQGIYVETHPADFVLDMDADLALELAAWDAASDEDFWRFERENE